MTKGFMNSDSFSRESPQDVYNFTYSSQDSTYRSSAADPNGLLLKSNPSSQEDDELVILSSRNGREDGGIEGFGDGVFWKASKKVKIGGKDPFALDSDELAILPSKKSRGVDHFGYSNGFSGNLGVAEPVSLNSSQESDDLVILPMVRGKERGRVDGVSSKTNKLKENGGLKKKKKVKSRGIVVESVPAGLTTTLMETQEFGEMMEHVDEVNFSLDGLKRGQPVRVRRASLLSLLSKCGTAQQRRLLRAHGTAKTILDAVLGLSLDDSLSNLASVALFYVLTTDGQDDCVLDSPSCIRFLLKLLKPLPPDTSKAKVSSLGNKLLAIRMDAEASRDSTRGSDSSYAETMLKVEEALVNCKDLKPRNEDDDRCERPELDPRWISLLTMEKACLSTVSIEDTSGRVKKGGSNFKEKLRELGGLNAVFEVARTCHSIMEGWLGQPASSFLESKDDTAHKNLLLLLKCMQIMENGTFLSEENQRYLLGMKGNLDSQHAPRSFTKLVLSVIKILSGLSLLRSNFAMSQDVKSSGHCSEKSHASDGEVEILSISSSSRCCTMEKTSSQKCSSISDDNLRLTFGQQQSSISNSEATVDPWLKMRIDSSTFVSCSATSGNVSYGKKSYNKGVRLNSTSGYQVSDSTKIDHMDESDDPFAFDEDDFEPSKWDLLSGGQKAPQTRNFRAKVGDCENGSTPSFQLGKEKSDKENDHTSGVSCSAAVAEEKFSLLSDCLLSSVKVLMNLTNDNPVGCQQIAACGGLETLSSLIAIHFPTFRSYLPAHPRENSMSSRSCVVIDRGNEKHLTDQQLDLLVAILGLLVNLVEKDGPNRLRLAAASFPLLQTDVINDESQVDLIPLLCSIFMANQGAGETTGEEAHLSVDDEDIVSQGEKEAEKMILEAYAALLLAFLSTESRSIRKTIAECLPDHNLAILVPVLERFVEFHLALNMISSETHTTVLEVIESLRLP